MKKNLLLFAVIALAFTSCSSNQANNSTEESGEVDLDNLTFCDCKNNRFDIKGEIQRATDPQEKSDLQAELDLFNEKCKQYDLPEGATDQERIDYQLDWNKKASECR